MAHGAGLLFDLIARDGASPAFLKVAAAADKAAAATARAEKGVAGSAAAMSRTGGKLTKSLTLPLLAIGAVSVSQASKWQKSMTLIQTAGGETAAKTAVLSTGLKKMAVETGTSLDALGEGIYTIAKAGAQKWSAIDQLKVMRAAAQGAKAENVDLGTATDALSTVMLDYHLSADKAVQTENQLIRASGLAKTTFGEFSSSMSNVVPIAAALGVKFAEVAGGIATMTQHGVSPAQATENMRNLLFNLAGQNNVASQAMQQLGINTVDLAKNLGRRGLTGTLAIVDKALADHTRRGMVVIDVHKAAALATKSLNTMLGQMSGPLEQQSKGLLNGSVSIKDYTAFAKGLGGEAGASALQFKALYLNTQGFSNQLRNGKGTVTTSTAQYAKLLGGMTGASVAMQIAGKYAHDNARNVREVGKAALDAGADVLGWNKTQDTLAVKMDKAKASLQVMAVEIGTALIPAVSKIVDWVSRAVHWFDSLGGTQKKVLLWSAGVLLALGPILSIGGRLAKVGAGIASFATKAGRNIASIGGASETTATRVGTAMRRVSGAVSGVLAGGVAAQVGGTSTGGWLTSIFLGTAGGWALGGPVGAAVGGVSAAIFKGVGLWSDHKKAAQAATQAEMQYVAQLTSAIQADNGMIGKTTRLLQIQALGAGGKDSILNQASGLHISLNAVVDASLGKGAGLSKDITGQAQRLLNEANANQEKILALGPKANTEAGAKEIASLKARNDAINAYLQRLKTLQDALAKMGIDLANGDAAWRLQFQAVNANRGATGDYTNQLGRLRKGLETAENTDGSFMRSLRGTGDAAKHNRGVIIDLAKAARTDAESVFAAQRKHEGWRAALKAANGTLATHIRQIMSAAKAAGLNKGEVADLIAKYARMPKSVSTYIKKYGVLPADIQKIIDRYHAIPRNVVTTVTTVTAGNLQSTYNSQVPGAARNGVTFSPAPAMPSSSAGATGAAHRVSPAVSAANRIAAAQAATDRAATARQAASDRAAAARQAAADRAAAARQAAQDRAAAFKQAYDTKLSNAQSRLATARSNYRTAKSTVRSAFTGSYDITQAGGNSFNEPVTFSAMKRQLDKAVANAKRFTQALRRLGHEGLNKGLIQQLADAGPSALPQALALLSATPKQLRAFNAEYGQLGKAGGATGRQVADEMYGAGVKSAQGLVDGLLSKRSAVNKAVKTLSDGMIGTLRKELNMHSPSRRLFDEGALAFEGYRQGIESKYGAIEDAAAGAGAKSVPGRGGSAQVGGPAIGELHLHYSHPDDYHRATATAMRAATTVLK